MGAQDSLEQAGEFLEITGVITPLMIWDESFTTWSYYGITGQPTAILVATDGQPIAGWLGRFDEEEVLRLAAEA